MIVVSLVLVDLQFRVMEHYRTWMDCVAACEMRGGIRNKELKSGIDGNSVRERVKAKE